MEQLVAFLAVQEVCQSLTPAVLKFHEDLDKLDVVLQLWVDHLDVLVILP